MMGKVDLSREGTSGGLGAMATVRRGGGKGSARRCLHAFNKHSRVDFILLFTFSSVVVIWKTRRFQ